MGRIGGVLGPSWGRLGRSWRRLGPSWERLGTFPDSLESPWGGVLAVSGASSAVQRISWAVLWESWNRLGVTWGRPVLVLYAKRCFAEDVSSWMQFLNRFVLDLASEHQSPNLEKSLNSIGKMYFLLSGYTNMTSLLDVILVST